MIAPDCLEKYLEIARSCVKHNPNERPDMGEVEVTLELALELQEEANEFPNLIGSWLSYINIFLCTGASSTMYPPIASLGLGSGFCASNNTNLKLLLLERAKEPNLLQGTTSQETANSSVQSMQTVPPFSSSFFDYVDIWGREKKIVIKYKSFFSNNFVSKYP